MNIVLIPVLMHSICCILPAVLAMFGVTYFASLHETLETWDLYFLGITGTLIIMGLGVHAWNHSRRCTSTQCKENRTHEVLLACSIVIFVVNLLVVVSEKIS